MNLLTLKRIYHFIMPHAFRNAFGKLRISDFLSIKVSNYRYAKTIKRLQNKKILNVVFFAMDLSFWKFDLLFKKLQEHPKFEPYIVLAPHTQATQENKELAIARMKKYFGDRNYPILKSFHDVVPDILFYTQPYRNSIENKFSFYNFPNVLPCYVPYAFWMSNYSWGYDMPLHNNAWKLFYPTEIHRENFRQLSFNKGRNVCITGYPLTDFFLNGEIIKSPWKKDSRKKIIWASHHSIFSTDYSDCGVFLKIAEPMKMLAKKWNEKVQFAFKPHPLLKNSLYRHPEWGKKKTDDYYHFWESSENTIITEGEYIDLFKTSDAIVHDCGSFTVEYLLTKKPAFYMGNERNSILCPFGQKATQANYTSHEISLEEFIERVVIQADDPKQSIRTDFFDKYLLPPHGKSVATNIIDCLISGIFK